MPNVTMNDRIYMLRRAHIDDALTRDERVEVYNAISDRCNALRESIAVPELPEIIRESLTQSLANCEKLVEMFE